MRTLALLVVNAGSSSVKFAVFAYPLHEGEAVATGNGMSIRFDAEPDAARAAMRVLRGNGDD